MHLYILNILKSILNCISDCQDIWTSFDSDSASNKNFACTGQRTVTVLTQVVKVPSMAVYDLACLLS